MAKAVKMSDLRGKSEDHYGVAMTYDTYTITQKYVRASPVTASMHFETSKSAWWKLRYGKNCFFDSGRRGGKEGNK